MGQSLSKVYVHIVFSTKQRWPFLHDAEVRKRVHAYIGGILRALDSPALRVGGTSDHVHILAQLSKNRALADVIGEVKRNSSKWIKDIASGMTAFSWQAGYGAFSVEDSRVEILDAYIRNQEQHHRVTSYQDEVRALLKEFRLQYEEEYLWD